MAAGISPNSSVVKILVKTSLPMRIPQWTERILLGGGILMLGYCGFVLIDTWIFQKQENAALERFVPKALDASPVIVGPDGHW